ncbi:MAG: hypothetical protein E7620_05605 [Ruminococcaceae bacterium]|nr:hypothetical protein [Oscillospiraceae bacterium]
MERSRRLNGMDYALLLILLAVLILGGWLMLRESNEPSEVRLYRCLLRVSGLTEDELARYGGIPVEAGESVWNENGTLLLGRVESVASVPCSAENEGKEPLWNLEIQVLMEGELRAGMGIRVRELRIAAGGEGRFRFGRFSASAEILSVEEFA